MPRLMASLHYWDLRSVNPPPWVIHRAFVAACNLKETHLS